MSYLLAIGGLAAACVGWYLVQRWTGHEDARTYAQQDAAKSGGAPGGCGACALEDGCQTEPEGCGRG